MQTPEGAYPASPDVLGVPRLRLVSRRRLHRRRGVELRRRQLGRAVLRLVRRRARGTRGPARAHRRRGAQRGGRCPTRPCCRRGSRFDGDDGDDEWWDFQLDGYGMWLWAVGEHAARHGTDAARWRPASSSRGLPRRRPGTGPATTGGRSTPMHRHVSTLGCVVGGLRAASDSACSTRAGRRRHPARGGGGGPPGREAVSAWASREVDRLERGRCQPCRRRRPAEARGCGLAAGSQHAQRDRGRLDVDGGVHRYLRRRVLRRRAVAPAVVHCSAGTRPRRRHGASPPAAGGPPSTAAADGAMPEQVDGHLLTPARFDEWVDRWGTVAQPLLWSHAMLIRSPTSSGSDPARASALRRRRLAHDPPSPVRFRAPLRRRPDQRRPSIRSRVSRSRSARRTTPDVTRVDCDLTVTSPDGTQTNRVVPLARIARTLARPDDRRRPPGTAQARLAREAGRLGRAIDRRPPEAA